MAWAEGGTVRYSYERVDLPTGEHYVLVPVDEYKELKGKLSKSTLFDAFNLLKDDKKATYGHSSIRITGRFPGNPKVSVKIDSSKKGYASIIMAETVYTLTELGVKEVEFPGYYEGAMTRADVPFSAYSLTLPMWRALPLSDTSHAQIRLPDGELISASEFARRWKKGDDKLQKALFTYLGDGLPFTVNQVLSLLPKLDVEYVGEVTPLLTHDSVSVRKKALSVLEKHRNDDKVLTAVEKMMESDKSDKLARAAAEFLGKAKSDKFNVLEALYLLDKGSEKEAVDAAAKLGKRKGDERVVDALYTHLSDKRAPVSQASADALEALDADAKQLEALENKKIGDELRLSIARTLAEDKDDKSKIVGLTYIAENTTARSAELALRKLGKVDSDEARKAVEEFLSAETRRKRLTAADVLAEGGKVESLPALTKAVAKGENAHEIEEYAYKLLVAQPLDSVLEKTDSRDKVIKRLAYQALGERAVKQGKGRKVFDKLVQGADSRDAAIRGASAQAIGAFANDKALEVLEKLADDKSAAVRAGVAHGLANYKGGEMFDTLAGYLDDKSPEVVAAAIDAMAQRREATKWNEIKKLTEAKDPRVRANALRALSQLVSREDKTGVRNVISMLSGSVSDDNRAVQLTAIRQLATFKDGKATTGIAIQLNAADPNLRVAAIEALGKTGHESATELVLSVLEDPNPDIRRAAIVALGELDDKSAESNLEALLDKEEDPDLKKLIQKTLRKI
ncbi:HEAT repeat domain-containing protein [Persicimonas caeni]|nr:HEAT repeat domain-containing protein [Persicimonas caeni]